MFREGAFSSGTREGRVAPPETESEGTLEDPETGGLLNGMSQMGFGPFHSGYELYLEDWDPAAEWVRLDYGPGSPIFTFTVDLEEERA